jgi:hypothetical protein
VVGSNATVFVAVGTMIVVADGVIVGASARVSVVVGSHAVGSGAGVLVIVGAFFSAGARETTAVGLALS